MPEQRRRLNPHSTTYSRVGREARAVAALFANTGRGDILLYDTIKAQLGVDLQKRKHLVTTIKTILRREHDIILHVHPALGYEPLTESGKVDEGENKIGRLYRASVRVGHIYTAIDYEQLSALDRHRALAYQAINAGALQWTHERTRVDAVRGNLMLAIPVPFDAQAHRNLFAQLPKEPRTATITVPFDPQMHRDLFRM